MKLSVPTLITCSLLALSCGKSADGYLEVLSPSIGHYEIYKTTSSLPLEFTSEKVGSYNERIPLPAGNYLILADCSSLNTTIRPNHTNRLIAHRVLFIPPQKPKVGDMFNIQCNRHSGTASRQTTTSRYQLSVLEGKRDLLVGMAALKMSLGGKKPSTVSYKLSGVTLLNYKNMKPGSRYFVSPKNSLMALTQNQLFGKTQYLLPGKYNIEVNGTKLDALLAAGDSLKIQPAFIKIAHPGYGSSKSKDIPTVELNGKYSLDINETYPVLPSSAKINFINSKEVVKVKLESGKLSHLKAKSVLVQGDCSPWDWACLKKTKVFLYKKGISYPILKSRTDTPIFFFGDSMEVSIQGTTEVRYLLPDDLATKKLRLGKVTLTPKASFKSGVLTDLVRIEANGSNLKGKSLDINLKQPDKVSLIEGTYNLASYSNSVFKDAERKKWTRRFKVTQGQETIIPFNVYYHRHENLPQQIPAKNKKNNKISIGINQIIPSKIY